MLRPTAIDVNLLIKVLVIVHSPLSIFGPCKLINIYYYYMHMLYVLNKFYIFLKILHSGLARCCRITALSTKKWQWYICLGTMLCHWSNTYFARMILWRAVLTTPRQPATTTVIRNIFRPSWRKSFHQALSQFGWVRITPKWHVIWFTLRTILNFILV